MFTLSEIIMKTPDTKACVTAVRRAIESGAAINGLGRRKGTALHTAVFKNNKEVAKLLIKYAIDLSYKNQDNQTALQLAIWEGRDEMVSLLIEYGANPHELDNYQQTGLQLAAIQGHTKIARLLLKFSEDIDHINDKGETALHLAISGDHEKIIYLLIRNGANVKLLDQFNQNPLEVTLAKTKPLEQLVLMLTLAGGGTLNLYDHDHRFPKTIQLLQVLSMRAQLEKAQKAFQLFTAFQILPYESYIKQFQFRQQLLSQYTQGNKMIEFFCLVIALQSPLQNSWFDSLRYLSRYTDIKLHFLTWYNSTPKAEKTIFILNSIDLESEIEQKLQAIAKGSPSVYDLLRLQKRMKTIPPEINNIIVEATLSEKVLTKYQADVSIEETKQFKDNLNDMGALQRWAVRSHKEYKHFECKEMQTHIQPHI